jgi:hypothetical protein
VLLLLIFLTWAMCLAVPLCTNQIFFLLAFFLRKVEFLVINFSTVKLSAENFLLLDIPNQFQIVSPLPPTLNVISHSNYAVIPCAERLRPFAEGFSPTVSRLSRFSQFHPSTGASRLSPTRLTKNFSKTWITF